MIRRSFRFGLLVGLLGGLAFALVKALGGRDGEPAASTPTSTGGPASAPPWPRLDLDPAVPAPPQERLVADPVAPEPPAAGSHDPEALAPGPTRAPEAPAAGPARAPDSPATRPARAPAGPAPTAPPGPGPADGAERKAPARGGGPRLRAEAAPETPAREAPRRTAGSSTRKATSRTGKATGKGTPGTTAKAPRKRAATGRAWVEPAGEVCPTSHPVKAKLASRIFHVPGGLSYARTRPDRCYRDGAAAEADGLRPAKR